MKPENLPGIANHTELIWHARPIGGYGPIREHGLSEAELMVAYVHLIPEDDDDEPQTTL